MKGLKRFFSRIRYNSPVVLTFVLVSLAVLIADALSGSRTTRLFFSVYRSSPADPLTYVRLVGHVHGHASLSHYFSNMSLLLVVGPIAEEKYGSRTLLVCFLLTAVATGLLHCLVSPQTALLGASGIVFMLILLSAFAGAGAEGTIPLTLILVALMYFGSEIYTAVTEADQISQLTHIAGGVCGIGCGALLRRGRAK